MQEKKMRSRNHLFFASISFLLLLFRRCKSQPSTTGYACTANQSYYPCHTYAFYRASVPDLADIADLFGISRLSISEASNLSSPSAPLSPAQHLLIPIICSCNSENSSAFNTTYQIQAGDTFYHLSINEFQNLTTYQAVEAANPSLVPTQLEIGDKVVFPVFCQCPSKTQLQNNIRDLITYVFQPFDTLDSVAALLGSSDRLIAALNGENPPVFSTVLVPVSRIPLFKHPPAGRYPSGSTSRKGMIVKMGIGLGVLGAFLLIAITAIAWFWWVLLRRGRQGKEQMGRMVLTTKMATERSFTMDLSDCLDKYKVYEVEEVREATMGFDRRCLIQGSVYQGSIRGETFAIKKMKWNACAELRILQKVNHSNLVKLEGFCIDPNEGSCYLVYELVENGSLHSWLHGNGHGNHHLDWKTRLQIAVDVASGLQYIHQHIGPSVVHKDICASNILLDAKMRAKIANFGLARTGCNAITTRVMGTPGYLAPEYLANGIVSTKIDVFSFGVVLLELISGKEAMDRQSGRVIWMDAERILEELDGNGDDDNDDEREDILRGWMDKALIVGECCSMESLMNVMGVAKACLQREASKRPNMVDVVYILCKANNDFFFDFSEDGLPVLRGGVVAR